MSAVPIASIPGLSLRGSLGWTRATFQSEAELASPLLEDDEDPDPDPGLDPEEEEGGTSVQPGDLFPMVPEWSGTLGAAFSRGPLTIEVDGHWTGRQFLIGDEGNEETFPRIDADRAPGHERRMDDRPDPPSSPGSRTSSTPASTPSG